MITFNDEYFQKFGFREAGFRAMFEALQKFDKPTIVETGSVRHEDSFGTDGSSTRFFNDYVNQFGGLLVTIDVDARASEIAERLCPGALTFTGDSIATLYKMDIVSINFLYLDSFDIDWENPVPSALHHISELVAAMKRLLPGSVVFVDDNKDIAGKGIFVRYALEKIGAEQIFNEYQIGFRLP